MARSIKDFDYLEALAIAQGVVDALKDSCYRIEICGSLRREKIIIHDIEIVAIPIQKTDLFGESTERTALDDSLAELRWKLTKNGPKYKQFSVSGINVDLFLASSVNYGLIKMIRTGSARFSKKMVTRHVYGGLMPNSLTVKDGYVWNANGETMIIRDEDVLFDVWQMPYVAPKYRD